MILRDYRDYFIWVACAFVGGAAIGFLAVMILPIG